MEHAGERLKQIRKHLGLTQEQLARKMGFCKANIAMIENGKARLIERNIDWLVQNLKVNPDFIRFGKLPMFLPPKNEICGMNAEKVPLYNLKEVNSLKQLFRQGDSIKPEDFIIIPHLPKCDGAVYYIGDMMHPILRSGDMVLYSKSDPSEIFSGDMYLVAVETSNGERISVCYLDKTENPARAVMRGADPSRAGTEIDISKIRAIASVNATIRLNTAK